MAVASKLKEEVKALALASLYFSVWLGALILIKTLLLAEYQIEFNGWSKIIVGILVLAKVVLILERVPLGTKNQPAWTDVLLRTVLYVAGVFIVMLLENGFEGRHEYGGFGAAMQAALIATDHFHVWVNTICISAALLGYNVLMVIRRNLGEGELARMFLSSTPDEGR